MSGISKDKLVFDTSVSLDQSDNVGSFLRSSDGTLLTHTTVGAMEALDVNLASGAYNEDSAHASGDKGLFMLAVRNDADATLTSADGDYSPIAVDSAGRVKVLADLDADFDFVFAEDSAHTTGDQGAHMLAVRQDTLASSVSADGDYASFKLNARGGLWTVPVGTVADDAADTENPVKIGSRAVSGALTAVSASNDRADAVSDLYRRLYINDSPNIDAAAVAVSVDTTAGGIAIPTTALAGRRRILIQNTGNHAIFVGKTGVTSTTGFRVAAGATLSLEIGQNIALFAIASSGTQNVRVLELA